MPQFLHIHQLTWKDLFCFLCISVQEKKRGSVGGVRTGGEREGESRREEGGEGD